MLTVYSSFRRFAGKGWMSRRLLLAAIRAWVASEAVVGMCKSRRTHQCVASAHAC
jgi:hypothetical protein